ncbi:MAG: helix-turn-helix transcriptional regulator, partial [Bacteroidales bacterium]|nr:helix-turn-helix transcriptional regulator [Bacteroidales bacterium]
MKTQEKIGEVLKQLRCAKGLSQEKLALDINIDRTYIGDIERGNRNISIAIIEKMTDYYQISLSDFF